MARLDIDLLQTFVSALEAGSISAAAPRVGRSQSAASEQIRKLEEVAGTALLARAKSGVRATAAGERLLLHARAILTLHETALDELRGIKLAGDLHLAITDYFRPDRIAFILKTLRARHPRLRLKVSIVKSQSIANDGGLFDLGLFMHVVGESAPSNEGRLPLHREKLDWVAADDFDPEPGTPLPIVALPATCAIHKLSTSLLERYRMSFYLAHATSGVAGLQSAITAGLGIACLNRSAHPVGSRSCSKALGLPPLPDVEFALTPPLEQEEHFVADVRAMLAATLRHR